MKFLVDPTTPLLFCSNFKEYIREIIYLNEREIFDSYSILTSRLFTLVDFTNYRYNRLNFNRYSNYDKSKLSDSIFYAYGILINPFRSNLILLDYDKKDLSLITEEIYRFIDIFENVLYGIDVIASSPDNYHLHIGLNSLYNTYNIYKKLSNICIGYRSILQYRGECVLRVSQKFYKTTESPSPEYMYTIRKIGYHYVCSKNISYPVNTVITQEQEIETPKTLRLNLRN